MPEVDREEDPAGHRVRGVGLDLEATDGEANRIGGIRRQFPEPVHHLDGGDQGVPTPRERHRPRVRLLPRHLDAEPSEPLDPCDDADRHAGGLKDRPLLDVGFDVGGDGKPERPAARHRRGGQGLGQRRPHRHALPVGGVERGVERQRPGKHGGSHRRRLKAGALFVGPDDELERAGGRNMPLFGGLEYLEGREDAEDPVEVSPGRLGIEVRSGDDGGGGRIGPWPADKQVPDRVNARGEAPGGGPGEHLPAGRGVAGRERLAIDAAAPGGPRLARPTQ